MMGYYSLERGGGVCHVRYIVSPDFQSPTIKPPRKLQTCFFMSSGLKLRANHMFFS